MRRLAGQAALRLARLAHALARIAFALALLAGVGAGVLSWRLASGPLELPWLVRQLEAAANTGAARWSVGRAALAWEGFSAGVDRPLDLELTDVAAVSADGITVAQVPALRVSLSLRALLMGRFQPRAIELRGATLRAVRGPDGALTVDLGDLPLPEGDGAGASLPDLLAELAQPLANDRSAASSQLGQLQRILVRDGSLRVTDRKLGIEWHAPTVTIDLRRDARGGAIATAEVLVRLGDQAVPVSLKAVLGIAGAGVRLEGRAGPVNPARLAVDIPPLRAGAAADLDVTLAGTAQLDAALHLGHAGATLKLGAGRIAIARGSVPIAEASLAAQGTAEAIEVTRFAATLAASSGPTRMQGTARLQRRDGAATADIAVTADRVDFATLAELWPDGVGGRGAKPWVTENITAGEARNLNLTVALGADAALSEPRVTAIAGGFDAHDLTVHWLRPIPPMEHGEGRLYFVSPDVIEIAVSAGRQGALTLQSGLVRLIGLSVRDQLADIEAELDGPLSEAITLLRNPKLQLLSKRPIPMNNPSGQAHARIGIAKLPLEMWVTVDDVKLQASAKLANVRLGGIAAGRDLDQGTLELTASNEALRVGGTARVAGIPAKLQVDMDFRAGPGSQVVQTITASGTPDMRQLEAAGVDLTDFVSGGAPAELVWRTRRNGRGEMTVKADLTQAVLAQPRLSFTKPAGRPAQADLRVLLEQDRIAAIEGLRVTGAGVDVEGRIGFAGGRPALAQLSRIVLGTANNLRAEIAWPEQQGAPWRIALSGASLDGTAEFGRKDPATPKPPEQPGPRYLFDARLDRVVLGPGRVLAPVTLKAEYDGRITRSASIAGRAGAGAFTLDIAPAGTGRRLTGHAEDAGALLKALDLVDDMRGGTMTLAGSYDDRRADHPLSGRAEIAEFRMSNAPGLARLLQAMTLYGLVQMVQGPGLAFTRLEAPFRLADDVLDLSDARAFNASLGMTAKGRIDLARHRCDVQGTIVPAYFFNSLLGGIPILGQLFSPEKGGGLFAATYTLRGPCDDPAVAVNPLAALTPGFLRGLFGIFDGATPPGAAPPSRADDRR